MKCLAPSAAAVIAALLPSVALAQIENTALVGQWNGNDPDADIWAEGNYAYMGQFGQSAVSIIDISDPTSPSLAVEYQLPSPWGGASAQDVKVHNGILYVALESSGGSAHLVDVRDPENPAALIDIVIPGFGAIHNVFWADGYLYMADSGTNRVAIIDLSTFDPDNPGPDITTTKWTMQNVGSSFVHDMTVQNGRLYACAWDSGIWIYDVTDVANTSPTFLGSGPGNNTHSCWPTDDGQFVITGEERTGGGITVYQITEDGPASLSLTVTDSVALPQGETFSVHNQAAIGNRVYNAWYGSGFQVYDVNPATGQLEFVASYSTAQTNCTWGIYPFLGTDRVLISDIDSGLTIIEMLVDEPGVPGDANGDGVVNVEDMVLVILNWGDCDPPHPAPCPGDLNGNGVVDVEDLVTVVLNWS